MLKPLVKRGLFFSIRRTLVGISPLGTTYHQNTFFGAESAQPILTGLGSGNQKKMKKRKKKKARLVEHFTPTPKRPPFTYTFRCVHVGWGHRRNHPCQVSSRSVPQFLLPRGSKFTISHRLGEWLLQQCYALTCYTVILIIRLIC